MCIDNGDIETRRSVTREHVTQVRTPGEKILLCLYVVFGLVYAEQNGM